MGQYDLTVGALLLGIFLNTYLYGLVSFQYLTYKNLKFNDPLWLKLAIVALFCIDTSQTMVGIYGVWVICVENYTNPAVLLEVLWTTPFCASATAVSAALVQLFLCHRLHRLTRQIWLAGFLALCAVVACACGIADGVRSGILGDVTKFAELIPLSIAWLALESAVDIFLTGALIFVLTRSKTGFYRTDTVLNRLIRGAVQTGLFSSIFAICNLLVFVFRNQTNLYALFNWPLGRIYSNTILDTLIVRQTLKHLQNGGVVNEFTTGYLSAPVFHAGLNRTGTDADSFLQGTPGAYPMELTTARSIHVQREVVTDAKDTGDEDEGSAGEYPYFQRRDQKALVV